MKRPFAKKTANMQEENAKNWAKDLQEIYDPLINCAKASREIKQLLKKYDAEKNKTKKENYIKSIAVVLKNAQESREAATERLEGCLDWTILDADAEKAVRMMLEETSE